MSNRQAEVQEAIKEIDFDANTYQVELKTNHGTILLDLLPDVAPGPCANPVSYTHLTLPTNRDV